MIQDIFPYRFQIAFQRISPAPENYFFSFREQKILLLSRRNGEYCLPTFRDLQQTLSNIADLIVYLFSIDDNPLYLVKSQDVLDLSGGRLEYAPIHILTLAKPEWLYFAAVTASHLGQWYTKNTYCGRCGDVMEHVPEQRAMRCNNCGNIVYPQIAPVVMVAVVNSDKLLLTKYADRLLPQWVLIAGFVEIGETIEDAAKREVYEETGIRIKNLKYFGSQPWGFSGSVIMGFIAELDGSDTIHLDHRELADAAWHSRFQLPRELTDISITYEMMETLRLNKKEMAHEYIRNRSDMQ